MGFFLMRKQPLFNCEKQNQHLYIVDKAADFTTCCVWTGKLLCEVKFAL